MMKDIEISDGLVIAYFILSVFGVAFTIAVFSLHQGSRPIPLDNTIFQIFIIISSLSFGLPGILLKTKEPYKMVSNNIGIYMYRIGKNRNFVSWYRIRSVMLEKLKTIEGRYGFTTSGIIIIELKTGEFIEMPFQMPAPEFEQLSRIPSLDKARRRI